jgi:hypothetical protein
MSCSYSVPLVGPARDFNLLESEPCRAHKQEMASRSSKNRPGYTGACLVVIKADFVSEL